MKTTTEQRERALKTMKQFAAYSALYIDEMPRKGKSLRVKCYIIDNGRILNVTSSVARALWLKFSDADECLLLQTGEAGALQQLQAWNTLKGIVAEVKRV